MQQVKSSPDMWKLSRCPQTRQLLIRHLMRAASTLTACACLISLVASSAFPVDADTVTEIQLSVENTLALYGDTVQGQYYTGSAWVNCSFEYLGWSEGVIANQSNLTTSGTPYDTPEKLARFTGRKWLFYGLNMTNISDIVADSNPYQIRFQPSINIRHLLRYDQFCASMGNYQNANWQVWRSVAYAQSYVSYLPASSYVREYAVSTSGTDIEALANMYLTLYAPEVDISGSTSYRFGSARYSFFDTVLQHTVDDVPQYFDYTGFELRTAKIPSVHVLNDDGTFSDYKIIGISCPVLNSDYINGETGGDYTEILEDMALKLDYINIDLEGISDRLRVSNNYLEAILDVLDAIYDAMDESVLPDPSLHSASTIPPTLQDYYSGVASGAPSASAVNGAIGDTSDFVPFSAILSSSGLGSLLGVLAGLCCAGWVLTRGRSG